MIPVIIISAVVIIASSTMLTIGLVKNYRHKNSIDYLEFIHDDIMK